MINTRRDRKNLYMKLDQLDLIGRLRKLLDQQGYILRLEDSKFVPRIPSLSDNAPWVYVKHNQALRCDVYHKVFYNALDYIPSVCRNCWKVVVRPQRLEQLFDLYEMQKDLYYYSKCGMELRRTVKGNYGGYFYTQGQEAGYERWDEIRRLVTDFIGSDVPVILKRYCTEFETGGDGIKGHGPSDQVGPPTDEELEQEAYVMAHFPRVGYQGRAEHVDASVMKRCIHHAYSVGDEDYKSFITTDSLFPAYVTYEEQALAYLAATPTSEEAAVNFTT